MAYSYAEIMNIPPIVSVHRQALHTFSEGNAMSLTGNMNRLKSMMDKLQAEDVSLEPLFSLPQTWEQPNKSPCTYIEVFENNNVNLSIFVLKPGYKITLHDHPQMYGLMKVISGAANVSSFTEYSVNEVVKNVNIGECAKYRAVKAQRPTDLTKRLLARRAATVTCRPDTESCFLTPTVKNYHEVQALNAPTAIIDILSPPYNTVIPGVGTRTCGFYKISYTVNANFVELEEIKITDPVGYDKAPYMGPPLI